MNKYQDHTEQLFIVGHPVAHSKSPAMHNAVYEALGLPWHYGFKDCTTEDEARDFFVSAQWLAVNVTMPYKPLAFAQATNLTDYAVMAQGANVLVRTDEQIYADNTDGRGCISFLERQGCTFVNAKVVVCGTGPTSLSILFAAAKAGAESVYLLSRSAAKAQEHIATMKERLVGIATDAPNVGTVVGTVADASTNVAVADVLFASSYGEAASYLEEATIIIDATPLGMQPGDAAPFDTQVLHAGQTVMDVVYGHGTTALIAAARDAGCKTFDGSGMLVAQAVQTVYDIQEVLNMPITLDASQLFTIMATAAGFAECL